MKKIKVMKLKRIMISYFMVLLFIVVIPSRVAAAELDSGDIFLKYPVNGQKYWIICREGFRDSRVELSTCSISGDTAEAYIEWNGSLNLKGANASEGYHQYKLSENGAWEQIGTYGRFSDYATSVIASNLDVYDAQGRLVLAKRNYSSNSGKINIKEAKIDSIGKQYYTGKKIKPQPKISHNGKRLYRGMDYTLSYKNNMKVGTASIIVRGKGNFNGTKAVKFKIVKKPQNSIKLSRSSLTLSLADVRTYTLKVIKNGSLSKVKWKSSDNSVVKVNDGKVTAKGSGTAKITAAADGSAATCKVTVKDTAEKTVSLSFKTFDEWGKKIKKKEKELVFGGKSGVNADGSTYYTGNIIVKRQILSYRKMEVRVSYNTPGYYKTVYLKLPDKIKYTLHRHNLKNDFSSDSVGKIMAGLVDKQLVWTQKCSCGYENVLTWDIPLEKPEKLTDGDTYVVYTNSLVIE